MPELGGRDTHTTSQRPRAAKCNRPNTAAAALGALLALNLSTAVGPRPATAQAASPTLQRSIDRRLRPACGGDSLDGVCPASCTGDPLDAGYDADCFSCDAYPPPEPKLACANRDEPCEIHEGIDRLGAMVQSGVYDDRAMRQVVMAYWDASAWDVSANWGASSLDGYVVYAMVRTALEFREAVAEHPTTSRAMECVLRDHAGRGIPTAAPDSERRFHGPRDRWNTWSEDYVGFALGYAAADAWLRTAEGVGPYFDEFYQRVREAVALAFSVSEDGDPPTLTLARDPDPASSEPGPSLMLRNHGKNSPVYEMVILKHVADINALYRDAGLPPYFTCDSKPATYDALYRWVLGKVEPNPAGGGYVFRADACERSDGALSWCDDRPGDPPGSCGDRREPGHYPLARFLPDLCVAEGLELFSAGCGWYGPAGIRQAPHNYYFNCVFPEEVGTWARAADGGGTPAR